MDTDSPSCSLACSAVVAATAPVRFALLTAIGPVSLSRSSATASSGIRIATVPLVSPRSQLSDLVARQTIVSPPGQNSPMSFWPSCPMSSTRAFAARTEPTSTGGGISRPRPLAASSRRTASGLKASAPTPYTVSVGSTTSSPARTAVVAAASPAARWASLAQSNQALIADHPAMADTGSWPGRGDKPVAPGEVGVVAGAVPPGVGKHPVHVGALLRAVLDADQSTGSQQPGRDPLDDPDRVHAVGAAPERSGRVVLAHLRRHGGADRDVRRVADHEVDLAIQVA